jgi:hypothetical protein
MCEKCVEAWAEFTWQMGVLFSSHWNFIRKNLTPEMREAALADCKWFTDIALTSYTNAVHANHPKKEYKA